ncbi:MAG TPA: HAD hydrolase family protein, partial [Candidatus Saccharimonadales bacterium]|nr:HAD hydrolase family protein [Candidatus Saccharimonadales bacterium]
DISTEEIIGIGDGHNDFPLLMACGLKVAMGNAVDDLKAIADYIAPSVDEDGVADVIEKFILNA